MRKCISGELKEEQADTSGLGATRCGGTGSEITGIGVKLRIPVIRGKSLRIYLLNWDN